MENHFSKLMAEHSDEKLIDILKNRNLYQPIAIDASINESINRKLIIDINDLEAKYPCLVSFQFKMKSMNKNI